MSTPSAAGSQTLARGLTALEILADAAAPLSIGDLAERLGVHRSSAYRVLRTLEEYRFALRDEAGMIRLGPRLAALARAAAPALHTASIPPLTELANLLGLTAFITVLDADEVITLTSIEPTRGHATVGQRPGSRHHIRHGAPGHAIETELSAEEHAALFGNEALSEGAAQCRELGYALSHDEVIRGLTSVAVPLPVHGEPPAALAIITIGVPENLEAVVEALQNTAHRISRGTD